MADEMPPAEAPATPEPPMDRAKWVEQEIKRRIMPFLAEVSALSQVLIHTMDDDGNDVFLRFYNGPESGNDGVVLQLAGAISKHIRDDGGNYSKND